MNTVKPLEADEVHVWSTDFDFLPKEIEYYSSLLSDDEKRRRDKFYFSEDRKGFVISRGILRILSGLYLNKDPKHIIFEFDAYGKPRFDFKTLLRFNISHSGNMVVLGFCKNHEIGVDIEKMKNDFDALGLAKNFFSMKEIASLEDQPDEEQYRAFFRCWTRKESFIKAKGNGLSFPLDSFSVSLDADEKAELLETHWDESERSTWNLFSFLPADGYIGAISVQGHIESISYRDWNSYMGMNRFT